MPQLNMQHAGRCQVDDGHHDPHQMSVKCFRFQSRSIPDIPISLCYILDHNFGEVLAARPFAQKIFGQQGVILSIAVKRVQDAFFCRKTCSTMYRRQSSITVPGFREQTVST